MEIFYMKNIRTNVTVCEQSQQISGYVSGCHSWSEFC